MASQTVNCVVSKRVRATKYEKESENATIMRKSDDDRTAND